MPQPTYVVIDETATTQGLNDEEDIEAMSNNTSVKKQKKLTPVVWTYFDRVTKGENLVAICKHCKKELSAKSTGGTSHLKNHLGRCMKKRKLNGGQRLLNVKEHNGIAKVENYEFDVDQSRKDFSRMVIYHELPFAFAGYVGFKVLMKNAQPLYPSKCPKIVKSDCMGVYDEEKLKMYEKLERVGSRFSITSDMWTSSCQNKGYMSVTAHYIDEEWVLQKRVLNFLHVEVPHNAEKLSQSLMTCLMEWNIDVSLFSMSLDNCTVNDFMSNMICEQLKSRGLLLVDGIFLHVRCAAHILNIIVQDRWQALGVGSKSGAPNVLEKVRDSAKYITTAPKKQKLFGEVVKQLHITCHKSLFLDCPHRWNSTYEMLKVALEYKRAFSSLNDRDREYSIIISNEEWGMVKDVADCLKLFYDVTNTCSGTKYPTANIFFHEICKINVAISKWEVSENAFIQKMTSVMRPKFDKYWRTCHPTLAIASILDPQFKMRLLDFYFPIFYGETGMDAKIKEMKYLFEDLYLEYSNTRFEESQNLNCEGRRSGEDFENVELSEFDQFIQSTTETRTTKRDIDYYLEEPVLPRTKKIDILSWWKVNEGKYPILAQMARDILGIPVSTVASESTFSTGGRVVGKHRSSLKSPTVQGLICGQDWLRDHFKVWEKELASFDSSHVGSNDIDIAMGVDDDSD